MLHPDQYRVNEAWIAFKLNGGPIHTEQDGTLDVFALMDAASCFVLAYAPVAAGGAGPGKAEANGLLRQAQAQKQEWAKTLLLPEEAAVAGLAAEAGKQGMAVMRVPEEELLPFIGEVREAFREHFEDGAAGGGQG